MPPKSILKTTQPPAGSQAPVSARDDPRTREIALYHARIIQEQKDAQAKILSSIATLLDSPSAPDADPKRPSAADALQFKALVKDFQPGDYDDLLEERKCADLCGYALCPRPPLVEPHKGKKRFTASDKGSLTVLPREKVELWCSEDCARRALYVKVQLNEEPSWLRVNGAIDEIALLIEAPVKSSAGSRQVTLPMRPKTENLESAMFSLALERGDEVASGRMTGLMTDNIVENHDLKPASTPAGTFDSAGPSAIEGYEPKARYDKNDSKDVDVPAWDV